MVFKKYFNIIVSWNIYTNILIDIFIIKVFCEQCLTAGVYIMYFKGTVNVISRGPQIIKVTCMVHNGTLKTLVNWQLLFVSMFLFIHDVWKLGRNFKFKSKVFFIVLIYTTTTICNDLNLGPGPLKIPLHSL